MFLIDSHSDFKFTYQPNAIAAKGDFLFVYQDNQIGLTPENKLPIVEKEIHDSHKMYCFGHIQGQQCLLLDVKDLMNLHLNFVEARLSYQILPEALYQAAAVSSHLHHWRSAHHYCGKCTSIMFDKSDEQALICPQCHHIAYPKISPCVIVLITRGEEMLLARSPHFPPEMMSTIAGFVAIGESVEQTLIREVKEEVGVQVANLRYICSQAWPFPDSLMLGFMADYVDGEIRVDKKEIERAAWFNQDNLPRLPNEISIARYLIDKHLESTRYASRSD